MKTFGVLFRKDGIPIDENAIKSEISGFSESYDKVVRTIISKSVVLTKGTFRFNVATLLPSFKMTRRGTFYGLKISDGVISDPNQSLDICWKQVGGELQNLKKYVSEKCLNRSRVILELPSESRKYIIEKVSELFDNLKWIDVNGSNVGRVAASKILFAVLPEIALPVDNTQWEKVFRTDSFGKVLCTMVEEINEWESRLDVHIDSLSQQPTTVPSVYNVMAMAARPS